MYCKLVNQDITTHGGFKWKVGKWYKIDKSDYGSGLCSESYFHCYEHPLLAILLNPIHADIENPKLFQVNVKGKKESDQFKFGFTQMRLAKEIKLHKISMIQKTSGGN